MLSQWPTKHRKKLIIKLKISFLQFLMMTIFERLYKRTFQQRIRIHNTQVFNSTSTLDLKQQLSKRAILDSGKRKFMQNLVTLLKRKEDSTGPKK
jgi:hypothetical protein